MKVSGRYQFGDFTFVPDPGHLTRDDRTIPLTPQAAHLLRLLLEAGDDGLSRADIMGSLWPGSNVADFDQSLNTCVRQLRRALNDTDRRIVETLPRRGYKLGVKVRARSRNKALALIALAFVPLVLFLVLSRPEPLPALDRNALIAARTHLASGDPDDLEAAREAFAHLAARRPDLAQATGGYALATALLAGRGDRDWTEWTAQAEASSQAALDLDPRDQSAHTALAFIRLYRDWRPDLAEIHAGQAVDAAPSGGHAYLLGAAAAAAQGDAETAARLADQAVLIQPLAMAAISDRCWHHFYTRRFDVAAAVCGEASGRDGFGLSGRLAWAEILYRHGRRDQALSILQQIGNGRFVPAGLNPADDGAWTRAHCDLAEWAGSRPGFSRVQLAAHQLACGDPDAALGSLETGLEARESGLLFVRIDPRFDPLRESDRFQRLLACVVSGACS